MKTHSLIAIGLLVAITAAGASAQCGMMGSGGQHKHGDKQSDVPSRHSDHKDAALSKGYAFINDDGLQEATITIKDGYQPSTVVVKKGIPLRLNFDLQEKTCTGTVVFKEFNIERELMPYELTTVEFTPDKAGSFTFACPMEMITGTLVVKE